MYTYSETLQALHDVVDADPNFVNDECVLFEFQYIDDESAVLDRNKPVCVVGHVLARLDLGDKAEWDNDESVDAQRDRFEEYFDEPATTLLDRVQTYADGRNHQSLGYTEGTFSQWGDALRQAHADIMLELLS